MRFVFVFFILLSFDFSIKAQPAETGNWWIYFGNQAINNKWNFHNEIQHRNYNFVGDLEQLLIRTGLGYNLTENNNNLLAGYAYIRSERYLPKLDEKVGTEEHRLFQQFITRHRAGRVYMQHRYRLEERFFSEDFKMRFRYFLAFNIPLNKSEMSRGAVYLSLYNEIFINEAAPAFDRDRLYGAFGLVFNKNIRAEIGYMAQIYENSNRNQFQLVVFNNTPFHRNDDK